MPYEWESVRRGGGGERRLLSTGVAELDEVLGGYPEGAVVVVAGNPGSGKTTLAAQFIYAGLVRGEPGLYVSLSERKEEFLEHMKRLGMDFEAYERRGLFKFLWLPLASEARRVASAIVEAVGESKCKRLVVDTVTPILASLGPGAGREFLHNLVNLCLKPARVTTLLLAELPYRSETIGFGFEEFVADAIIALSYEEYRGLTRRVLEVRKCRWCPLPRMGYEFVIGDGGVRLYISYAGSLKGSFRLEERLSTGLRELDEMLGGGIPRGAVVLIAGPSGTGKTLLALSMAIAEARRGGRPLYVSFEESVEQIEYVAKKMGLEGGVKVVSLSPRLFTPGSLYYCAVKMLEDCKPTLVVVDGISALERQFGEEAVELVRSVTMWAKARGITHVLTSVSDVLEGETTGISTVADVVIALGFEREHGRLRRILTVVKARGIKHDTRLRELVIEEEIKLR